jgi:hypothetical protein
MWIGNYLRQILIIRMLEGKLDRKYSEGLKFVTDSLKRYPNSEKATSLFPIVDKPSYSVWVIWIL